jgi:hypothetical protein
MPEITKTSPASVVQSKGSPTNMLISINEMNGAINNRLLTFVVVEDNCKPFSQKT